MYGGLFGDLPSAKSSKEGGDVDDKKKAQEPPAASSETPNEKKTSAVSGLGAVGTSMAFVPTALRPRKRPKPALNRPKTVKPTVIKAEPDTAAPSLSAHQPEAVAPQVKKEEKTMTSVVIENIHACDEQPKRDEPSLQEEAEELQRLHASVMDPYDPHVPNDLLAYRERKAVEQERLKLEREARETMERQQWMWQQLEQERQKIQKSGIVKDIIEHRTKTSMGRGRGVSNLPAWLLKKQKEEARLGQAPQISTSLRTVILYNLTAPGDIDDELDQEVKEECEERCGPVEKVEVKDAAPPHQPEVQVLVQFKTVVAAKKAASLFQGRVFGLRRIAAKLVAD